MTFSILARDRDTGELGCAAATGNLAVGAWVLAAQASAGVVATQGWSVSTLWREEAMRGLVAGEQPQSIVDRLVGGDNGAGYRQLIILDTRGRSAGWTGEKNEDTKSHVLSPDLAIAGNWLANENTLEVLNNQFIHADGTLADRLLHGLLMAAKAGGDMRGTLSAAINVVSPQSPPLDLRIDYSQTPIEDLIVLYKKTKDETYQEFISVLPTIEDPHRC
ncbi:MAG: DUF1028 domain-containing protein [Gammaproteobacteria bacterium]|nr:DUF1028 domain-containing protein [Gammaproteobacteria bacterium]